MCLLLGNCDVFWGTLDWCSSLSSYLHICSVLTLVLTSLFSFALTPPHIAYPNLLFKDIVLLTLPHHQFLSFTWFILFDDIKVVVFVHVFIFIYHHLTFQVSIHRNILKSSLNSIYKSSLTLSKVHLLQVFAPTVNKITALRSNRFSILLNTMMDFQSSSYLTSLKQLDSCYSFSLETFFFPLFPYCNTFCISSISVTCFCSDSSASHSLKCPKVQSLLSLYINLGMSQTSTFLNVVCLLLTPKFKSQA